MLEKILFKNSFWKASRGVFGRVFKNSSWHHLTSAQVFAQLQTSELGLSYGLARRKLRLSMRKFKLNSFYFLIGGYSFLAVLAWFSGGTYQELNRSLVFAIFAAATLQIIQEIISTRQISNLRSTQSSLNLNLIDVLRDAEWWNIPLRELVVGDLVRLQAGDRLEVDVRLFSVGEDFQVNQANIGGTVRTFKQVDSLPLEVDKLEQTNMLYSGAVVNVGEAKGVVVSTDITSSILQIQIQQLEKYAQIFVFIAFLFSLILGKGLIWSLAIALLIYPYNWQKQLNLVQLQAINSLEKFGIQLKVPIAHLVQLSIICTIIDHLSDRAFNYAQPDSQGLSLHGILRGNAEEAELLSQQVQMPIYSYADASLERIRLWQLQGQKVAIIGTQIEDISLFHQADLSICDLASAAAVIESASVIVPAQDFDLIAIALLAARGSWQRMHQVIWFYAISTASFLIFILLSDSNLIQLLWLGTLVMPLLSWALWQESGSLSLMTLPISYFHKLIPVERWFSLGLGISAIALPSLILFYFGNGSYGENQGVGIITLVVGLILYATSMTRSPFIKNYFLIGAISLILITLYLTISLIPTSTGINGWQWLTAILAGTCALWVQQFTKP